MKWYVKKVKGKWRIYLDEKFVKEKEPVSYGSALSKKVATTFANRLNNPLHDDFKIEKKEENKNENKKDNSRKYAQNKKQS